MSPADCPPFNYESIAEHDTALMQRLESFLVDLRSGALLTAELAADSRSCHRGLFHGLTPTGCEYYAGHYRGEPFRCLMGYEVRIDGDPSVGTPSVLVAEAMRQLAGAVRLYIGQLDSCHSQSAPPLSDVQRLRVSVAVAAEVFEKLLRVHPYANGNGHAARLVVWAILVRYGYYPYSWTIHPRPGHPDYARLIIAHRNGNRGPLQAALLQSITRPPLGL